MQSDERDRGQAVVLLLAVVVMAALSVIAIGRLGSRVIDRGRAQTAADAAALAATSGGQPAAERLASRNGGRLISYEVSGDSVVVVVDVAGERAVARATDGP
ncbi:MAG: pilus assembly protein TadG-related protein [Ilumatobacteraceae bacterium]